MAKLVLLNKPFKVLSQFTDSENRETLAKFIPIPNVYVAGRLDYDSEGLLLLTDDGQWQHAIANPEKKMEKTYWVHVEGDVSEEALDKLRNGVRLKDGKTRPAKVKLLSNAPAIWPRKPPIRERKYIPDNWLEITICEGKNRQVRRMTAAVGLPTLRLIRYKIGEWTIDNLPSGSYTELELPPSPRSSAQAKKPRTTRPNKHNTKPKFSAKRKSRK
jgi:23S rRNA pseudouridine2457 synthase